MSDRCATTWSCRSAPATCGSRADEPARSSAPARRRFRRHNAAGGSSRARSGRRWPPVGARRGRRARRSATRARHRRGADALERMWPVLTPAQLLHDLFGSKALLKSGRRAAARRRTRRCAVPASAPRRSPTCGGRVPTSRCSTRPATCSARSRQERQGRRVRRDPHLRPHRDRRGPGPHADAAEDGDASLAQRVDDHRRRHRPGDRSAGARRLGRRARLPTRSQAGAGDRPVGRLPHPAADHAARRPGDGARHAVAAARRGRSGSATPLPRSSPLPHRANWRPPWPTRCAR